MQREAETEIITHSGKSLCFVIIDAYIDESECLNSINIEKELTEISFTLIMLV